MSCKETKLHEILELDLDEEQVNPKKEYPFAGIYSFGKGLFKREDLKGSNTSYPVFNKLHKDRIALSKVKGWEGAIALVTEEFEGMYLSPVFPTFKAKNENVDLRFVSYFLRRSVVWNELFFKSTGLGARRNNVSEEQFLSLSILLPPHSVQIKIANTLDEILVKTEEVLRLRSEQRKDFEKLVYLKYLNLINDSEWVPFAKVSPVVRRPFKPQIDVDYIEIGIRSFGNGTFQKPPVKGKHIAHKSLFKMEAGDLVFSNVFSWEGAIALAKLEDDVCIGSHRFITTVPDAKKVNPEFLRYHLLSPRGLEDINKASPGTAGRNKTLGVSKLEKILVPVPDLELQNKFVQLLHKVKQIKKLRSESEVELKALFPSILDKAFKGEW